MARRKNRGPRGAMTEEELESVVRAYIEYDFPDCKPSRRYKAMRAMAFNRSEDFMRKLENCIRTGRGCNGSSFKRAVELHKELSDGNSIVTTPTVEPQDSRRFEQESDSPSIGCAANQEDYCSTITIECDGNVFTMDSTSTPHDIIHRLGIKEFHCKLDS